MGLLHDLQVSSRDQRGFFQKLEKDGAECVGTALSFSVGPQPIGREMDGALHLMRVLMEERAHGAPLSQARQRALATNDYGQGISDVLMAMPTVEEVDRTPLWALQQGMVLEEDVVDENGRLLARAGQCLTDRVVNSIQRQACIEGVLVQAA